MCARIETLKRLALSWGGDLVSIPAHKWRPLHTCNQDFYSSPFTDLDLGVLWEKKQVVYSGKVRWYEVIHEMGHVFATLLNPEQCNEFEFFGWEYAVARLLRGTPMWKKSQADYGIGELPWESDEPGAYRHHDFGNLVPKDQDRLLKNRVQVAQDLGLVDKKMKPLAIR